MIICDASAVAEIPINSPPGRREPFALRHLLHVEVVGTPLGMLTRGRLDAGRMGSLLYTTEEGLRKGHRAKVRYFGGWVQ
jgi:hypothetical protein